MKFNYYKLLLAVQEKRYSISYKQKKAIGLRELFKQTGISSSTFSRLFNEKKIDIDTILILCEWLNQPITKFISK